MCEREETGSVAHGSSEGAAHVPEELALEQGGREGRAVDRLEWRLPTGALRVDCPRYQLFARPGFAPDQHGAMRRGDASDQGEDRLHLGGHAVDAVKGTEPQRSSPSQNGGMHVATLCDGNAVRNRTRLAIWGVPALALGLRRKSTSQ